MKSRTTPWIIAVLLVLAATAASAEHKHYTEYKSYTAFSIENRLWVSFPWESVSHRMSAANVN